MTVAGIDPRQRQPVFDRPAETRTSKRVGHDRTHGRNPPPAVADVRSGKE